MTVEVPVSPSVYLLYTQSNRAYICQFIYIITYKSNVSRRFANFVVTVEVIDLALSYCHYNRTHYINLLIVSLYTIGAPVAPPPPSFEAAAP